MNVSVFIPCFIDQLFPRTGENFITLLQKVGCEVQYNPNQSCCGQPSYNSGYTAQTQAMARKFLQDFVGNDIIVSPGGSCTGFVKRHYASLFENEQEKQQAQQVAARMYEICDFLVNYLKITDVGAEFSAKVCVHDSCAAMREYGLRGEPRELLSQVKGLEIVEMPESDTCCGFGGTFSVKQKAISQAMVEQKVQYAIESGAQYITSTEASCLMNIAAYIEKNNCPITAIHIVDILAHSIKRNPIKN
ncbi:MAG: (Fe-S)-binding protein [Bacteroidales bacterium]|jgi:L-lactate dehydrogenase complex protein LldE|nr:(Fe-S)-binding protein [Bacteroidales bacterium]